MLRTGALSRRRYLAVVGGSAAGASALGSASAGTGAENADGARRVTVGYAAPGGERAARALAHDVVYEFAFDAVTVLLAADAVEELRARDDVRYTEYDGVYRIFEQTLPWGVDRVDADVVHEGGDVGDGAHVAIIDTGIDAGHPDLEPNLGEGVAFSGGTRHGQWQDDNGHGTHCAGTVAAVDDDEGVVGVAPEATLHAVKVMAAPGSGLTSDVAKGIEWVAEQGYEVANLSIGGDHLESVADACEYAAAEGVTLVAAAGNEGSCSDCVSYPAAYPEVIAVTGTTKDDEFDGRSSQGPEVDLAAPGTEIYSTYLGGYRRLSGTSMACPHVAGAAAQLAAGGRSRDEIRRTLEESAEDVGLSENRGGSGLLDVASAMGRGGEASTADDDESSAAEGSTPAETSTPSGSASASGSGGGSADVGGSSPADAGEQSPTATPTRTSATETPGRTPTATAAPDAGASPATPTAGGGGLGSVFRRIGDAIRTAGSAVREAVTGILP